MKVQCKTNRRCDLHPTSDEYATNPEVVFDLTVGQSYLVYALYAREGEVDFYLCGDYHDHLPVYYSNGLFELIDPRPSRYWEASTQVFPETGKSSLLLAFPAWAHDPAYYWNLTEQDPEAI